MQIAGILVAWSETAESVGALTCEEANVAFTHANWGFSAAFALYYYGVPTTCAQVCANRPDYNECLVECEIERHTALAVAEITLWSAAWATCTPATLEACDQARQAAQLCALMHNYDDYLDYPDQYEDIYNQYTACIIASKIDSCQ